ncbi:MAG: ATP-binding protein [Mucilaginibacter sp.]|uniref:PAS domain-containing sensor histidine kinase n=1 Tax=Mucilaginibacter sp. TaxID=1882438 RepID=UPI0034E3BEF8
MPINQIPYYYAILQLNLIMPDTNNEILKEMTEQSEDVFFVFNAIEKRFAYVSSAFDHITKRSCTELHNHPLSLLEIVHQEDLEYVKENFDLLLSKKTESLLDFRICRSDKAERWIRLKVYPIIEGNQVQYLSGTAVDDTARKVSIFNMQKINGWKDSVLEILSHDLRGPIGTVRMLAEAIANKLPEAENKQIHQWTDMIRDISKRNLSLIKNILTRESLDTAGVEISKERVNLIWEINEVMHIFIQSQKNLDKNFEFTHSHDNIYAEIDSMKFLQIINNLVANAIKFTKENGQIKIHLEKLEKSVLITVSDNGIGIPKNLHPVLFNKYTEAGRQGVDGEESVGLGMWIVKSLIDAHGGRVWFESEENKGSKFYVELPIRLQEVKS